MDLNTTDNAVMAQSWTMASGCGGLLDVQNSEISTHGNRDETTYASPHDYYLEALGLSAIPLVNMSTIMYRGRWPKSVFVSDDL